ncbi:MAG: methyltransferase domain-containing protein [Nitrospinota bacterium]
MGNTEQIVQERYAAAAGKREEALCSPGGYDLSDLESFIPQEVLNISYGCGTPASVAHVRPGDTVVDIGSGGGIDCFDALRRTGPSGRIIGVDMTEEMLEVARKNAPAVAKNLGHEDVRVEFRKGLADELPVDGGEADLVISNCVINLTPDKERVFSEIFRVLRPGGRFCISDIVADRPVPNYLIHDPEKWGACLSGALPIKDYLSGLNRAEFLGLEREKFSPWQAIDGIHFISATLLGYKMAEGGGSPVEPIEVVFRGPFSAVQDELGNEYRRGVPRKVDGKSIRALGLPGYQGLFEGAIPQGDEIPAGGTEPVLPEDSPCLWQGRFAILAGPFLRVQDDDNHVYLRGEAVEICSKTQKVLEHPHYAPFFGILNRAQREITEAKACCAPADNCC